MTPPHSPANRLISRIRRRLTRLQARNVVDCAKEQFLVSFSFDDFPHSAASTGAQILEHFGWRGTYYASAGFENSSNHLGELFKSGDVSKLVASGHEIGCHSENHIDCCLNPPVVIERDVRRNQERLRALGAPLLRSFAFPYGEASASAKTLLSRHYASLRGVHRCINRHNADANQLGAVPIEGTLADKQYALSFVNDLGEAPGWLIFYTHDVHEKPGEWGCTPALFEAICTAVQRAGFTVLPVGQAFAALTALEYVA